jgi:hypothetical protein
MLMSWLSRPVFFISQNMIHRSIFVFISCSLAKSLDILSTWKGSMGKQEQLRHELLGVLSFMEPMGLEKIYLDLNADFLQNHPELTVEDLLLVLKELEKQKQVTRTQHGDHSTWLRVFPKRKSWWQRLFTLIKG